MTEDVLQFIWQSQSFQTSSLVTTAGDNVKVYHQGKLNTGSGPDFTEARIKINDLEWSGDIEIHTYASLWDKHNHNQDSTYDKVILHVVWQEDSVVSRSDNTIIPTIELKNWLDEGWLEKYNKLMQSLIAVPCTPYLEIVDPLVVQDAIHIALVERLELRSEKVRQILRQWQGDWEKTALIMLFKGFGFNKNGEAFEHLASIIDLRLLGRLSSVIQVEAYLFGLAGLLPAQPRDDYVYNLLEEYHWINKKYAVAERQMSPTWWKFMRMRPSNFPTLRIAQLAKLLFNTRSFFRKILEQQPGELEQLFNIKHSEYWQFHYHFNSTTAKKISGLGAASQQNLIINVVVPLLVAYGHNQNEPDYIRRAVALLELIKPESNNITRLWRDIKVQNRNAAESQGLISLFKEYCKKSRCLSCSVGKAILRA